MAGWPRLLLIGIGLALPALAGVNIDRDDESAFLYIGGVLILAALFWPGAHFICENEHYIARKRAFWPGPCEQCGSSLLIRAWGMPFPDWPMVRDVRAPRLARHLAGPIVGLLALVAGGIAIGVADEAQKVEENPGLPG